MITACIVTIGDEILIGQTLDTNSQFMAQKLTEIGISVQKMLTIPDTESAISETLKACLDSYDITLTTGGLGPTVDDITKRTIAELFNAQLVLNKMVLGDIEQLVKRKGREMTENNRKQAFVPENCEVLRNNRGTAPGMWFDRNGKVLVNMPGVPFEMKGLMKQVIEKIKATFELPVIVYKMVYTMGIPEAVLATKLTDWEGQLPKNIHLAYLPSPGRVKLRLQAEGKDKDYLESLIDKEIKKLYGIIPKYIYSTEKEAIAEVVGDLLRVKNLTIATAESCTGGNIAHKITLIAGSSDYFKGSVVAYANEVKETILNVDKTILNEYGAVSEPVVKQMVEGVCRLLNTDCGIATSGIAGPTGGTPEKPVGTVWIAAKYREKVVAKKVLLTTYRDINIDVSALLGLNMLRQLLID